MQCVGRTKTSNFRKRCGATVVSFPYVLCWQHVWQPFAAIAVLISAAAGLATITGYNLRNLWSSSQLAASSAGSKNKLHVVREVEVPANLLPLSFEQVQAFLNDEDKTIAEVRQFWKENGNRPVLWGGVVLQMEQADPNGPTHVGVGPASPRILLDMILVKFSPECAQDFLLLKNGDWINFLGTLDAPPSIEGFSFSRYASVSNATLVAYARRPDN